MDDECHRFSASWLMVEVSSTATYAPLAPYYNLYWALP